MSPGKWVLCGIGIVVLVVGLAVGGWKGGWWLQNSAVNHQAQIAHNSLGSQSGYENQAQNLITQISTVEVQIADPTTPQSEVPSLQAQKANMITQACDLIVQINNPTSDLVSFASQNCS